MKLRPILIFLFLVASFSKSGLAQGNYDAIATIDGTVFEEKNGSKVGLSDIEVVVGDIRPKLTDEDGFFSFKIPVSVKDEPTEVKIEINSNEYAVIHPVEGRFGIGKEKLQLKVELVVIHRAADPFILQKINKLKDTIKLWERKHKISLSTLNQLNKNMLDTIRHYTRQQKIMEEQINSQVKEIQKITKEKEAFQLQIDALLLEIKQHKDSISYLTDQLYAALESSYLRKATCFNKISAQLLDYLLRVRDIHQRLLRVEQYFPSRNNPAYVRAYNKAAKEYNEVFATLNEEQAAHLQCVQHNWKTELTKKQLLLTLDLLFQKLHHAELKPSLNEMHAFIYQDKMNKAKKLGEQIFKDVQPIIEALDKQIKETIIALKQEL